MFLLSFSTAKPSATSATLELDKLMASLSDFRVQSTVRAAQSHPDEPAFYPDLQLFSKIVSSNKSNGCE